MRPMRAVCSALSKPFNFMVGIRGKSFTVADLEAAAGKDERDWQQERAAFLLY